MSRSFLDRDLVEALDGASQINVIEEGLAWANEPQADSLHLEGPKILVQISGHDHPVSGCDFGHVLQVRRVLFASPGTVAHAPQPESRGIAELNADAPFANFLPRKANIAILAELRLLDDWESPD